MGKFGFSKKAKATVQSLMTVKAAGTPERMGGFYTNTTIAFVNGSPSTITDSASLFLKRMFKAGMSITISGSTANSKTYTIISVTAGTITLDTGIALTGEVAGPSVTISCQDNIFCKRVAIQALEANTLNVAIGGSGVLLSSGNGEVLTPLSGIVKEGVYLKDIYIDVGTNADGVSVVYDEVKTLRN